MGDEDHYIHIVHEGMKCGPFSLHTYTTSTRSEDWPSRMLIIHGNYTQQLPKYKSLWLVKEYLSTFCEKYIIWSIRINKSSTPFILRIGTVLLQPVDISNCWRSLYIHATLMFWHNNLVSRAVLLDFRPHSTLWKSKLGFYISRCR